MPGEAPCLRPRSSVQPPGHLTRQCFKEAPLPALSIPGRETEAEEEQDFTLSEAIRVRPTRSSVAPALTKRLNLAPTPPEPPSSLLF